MDVPGFSVTSGSVRADAFVGNVAIPASNGSEFIEAA
jgi:hypothetical protein